MKKKMFFILLLFIGAMSSTAQSGALIRYALCQKNINKIDVVPQGNLYSLRINLTEAAAGDFFTLTGNNIGKTLDIVFEDIFVTGAKIDSPVKTKYLLSVPGTEKEANRLRQRMLDGLDKTPCGRIL